MEPVDSTKNDGFSRRRISSILKAPRKSIRFPDPEQQENKVEPPKAVDKRNSRRVSFAPANDVLLFSKDVKNASPVRSPLQELMTTATTTQNRVSVAFAEDQPIMGMDTLLNAPLYASQHGDKVKFDIREDFAEKTMVFSTDDGFMDMTHSHTINIASDAELLGDMSVHHYDAVSSSKEKVDLGVEKIHISSSVSSSDPDFENFLANLSKPSSLSSKPVSTIVTPPGGSASEGSQGSLAQIKTQRPDVDKENQAPPYVSAVMDKSLGPEEDVGMDVTEARTGLIQGSTGVDDDPFQFLFQTQEMYSKRDNRLSQPGEKTKPTQNVDVCGKRDKASAVEERRRNTCGPPKSPASTLDPGFQNFLAGLSKEGVLSQSLSQSLKTTKSHIIGQTRSDDPFNFLLPTQDMYPSEGLQGTKETTGWRKSEATGSSSNAKGQIHQVKYDTENDCREKTVRFTADEACMDVTRSHTVNIATSLCPPLNQNMSCLPSMGEKTLRFNADDAAMDVTRSHTVNIATVVGQQSLQNTNFMPTSGEKTVRFNADDAAMDMTQSLTVNISSGLPISTPPEDDDGDVSMEMTEAQTGRILGFTGVDDPLQGSSQDLLPRSSHMKKAEKTSQPLQPKAAGTAKHRDLGMETSLTTSLKMMMQRSQMKFDADNDCRERTVRFTADEACMDVTQCHTVNIISDFAPRSQQAAEFLPPCSEKTVRFTADDAAMDVTKSHTVNIATSFQPQLHQNTDSVPSCGEKTVRFTTNDAAMDVTRSHTVNIATYVEPKLHQKADVLPPSGEKTVRFNTDDAAMDVTRSHTVNIMTDFKPVQQKNPDVLPSCGEKTVKFSANDAAMEVTRSHTVNIATTFKPNFDKEVDVVPTFGEKTVKFIADDAAMDMTKCLTVNIASSSVSDPVAPQDSNITNHDTVAFPLSVRKRESEAYQGRARPSSGNNVDPGFRSSLSRKSGAWVNPVITRAPSLAATILPETMERNDFQKQLQVQKPDVDAENEASGFEKQVNRTIPTDCPEEDVSMEMTEAQTGHILEQTCTEEPSRCLPSLQSFPYAEEAQQKSSEGLVSNPEIPNRPESLDSNESDIWKKEPEPRNQTYASSQKTEASPPVAEDDVDVAPSRKSRRRSLAELSSKIRRISQMINTAPIPVAMETAPLPQLELEMEKNPKFKIQPEIEPENKAGFLNAEENVEEDHPSATTPFKLQTKQLMSRLSVGGFQAKLPQRSKPEDPNKVKPVEEKRTSLTVNITNQLSCFDGDVSDIQDEELGSCEDMSEMIDTKSLQKTTEMESFPQEFDLTDPLVDEVFEQNYDNTAHGRKRPLAVYEDELEDEKRLKAAAETTPDAEMGYQEGFQSDAVESDGNMTTAASLSTQTTDYSNISHTASVRGEAMSESTFKQSLFESQLEDYTSDAPRKLEDGSITVSEFFKIFNIDFVIHNPRQSVLPGRISSDTEYTHMDLLKDRHINCPKQAVYEDDVKNLTEKVEGLKERMRDLDKPLKIVNGALWEEIRSLSEKELKSFGAKLKERNNLFRKMSKVQSHEMKEVLYSNIVRTNLVEQQKLRGKIEQADGMIKSLDDCISELEAELAAVEGKGLEDKQSLRSRQEEMQKVTQALTDNEREISELEMQQKQNASKVKRLRAETRNLESHLTVLHMMNEWKVEEKTEDSTIYSFLHGTFLLELVFEEPNGNAAENESDRKISHMTFKAQLDDEKSRDHACLVHKLLCQFIDGDTAWGEKYPTSRHVPKLLHDVGLVVSRCRLLGEELRLLKMWGGLKLDILNISCVDTEVHIVFSSLKKLSKFEVIFSVSLSNQLCVLQVKSFKNIFGNTLIQQIEEIVSSFSPAKNMLTKIIKKIHESLLC